MERSYVGGSMIWKALCGWVNDMEGSMWMGQ